MILQNLYLTMLHDPFLFVNQFVLHYVLHYYKLVLQNDGTNADNLEALASAASAVDITVSVLEDV